MQNETELVMESMVPIGADVSEKKVSKSKSLTMNEKRSMYGILSFLVIANRDGLLDDDKTQELMNHLPIFKTISEKKEYLSQEMFDLKTIEKDILKPMVLEHNAALRRESKKKGKVKVEGVAPKEPKKRVVAPKKPKVEVVVSEGEEKKELKKRSRSLKKKVPEVEGESLSLAPTNVSEGGEKKEVKKRAAKKKEPTTTDEVVPVFLKDEKKRGRKAKQQIVECNTEVNVNAGNSQEDQLAYLVKQLTGSGSGSGSGSESCVSILELKHPNPDPEEIDLADLDEVLSNLEEGEVPDRVMTPRLPEVEVEVEVEVEKKGKGKETKKKATKTSKK